jgi:hypothetical protein
MGICVSAHIPVDKTKFLFFLATCSNNGKLSVSPEPILMNGTSIDSNTSAAAFKN